MSRFVRSTATVSAFTAAGLFLGFWSHMVIAARFGATVGMDAYLAATTLPALVTMILSTSVGAVFIPLFTRQRETDPEEANAVLGALTRLAGGACLVVSLPVIVWAEPVMRLLAPGLDGESTRNAASMLRWLMPVVALAAVNEILSGAHYCAGRFVTPMWGRVLVPAFALAAAWAFGERLGPLVLVAATLAAQACLTVLLAVGSWRLGGAALFRPVPWRHPVVVGFARLAGPLALAMSFYKLRPVVERWIASGMEPGSISLLGYAARLAQPLQPLIASGIAIAGFAVMAEHAARGDTAGLRSAISRSCSALFFAAVPLAILLAAFAEPVIGLVLEHGAFTREDTLRTSRLFALYVLALPAGAVGTVVGQAFYTLRDVRTPILFGLLDFALFFALAAWLTPRLGLAALPAAFVSVLYVTSIWITLRLDRKAGFPVLPLFAGPFLRALAATGVALAAALLLQALAGSLGARSYAASAACLALGSLAYPFVQHFAFRSPETERLLRHWGAGRPR